jgi:phage shock protein PspC (stress-responsive transcriptional regulator)
MTRPQLVRSERDRVIAGVCAGLAEHFDLDPVLVRAGFVVAALFGPGLIAYVVLWIAVPKESSVASIPTTAGGVPGPTSPAIRLAEERFAKGEITADELATIRSDLEGSRGP